MYYSTQLRTDGFGGQYQNIIFTILYTELYLKGIYVHRKITAMEHNYNNDPLFLEKVENLMNLSEFENDSVEVVTIIHDDVYPWVEENLDYCLQSETMKRIRNCFWKNKIKKEIDVAVHVRRPNCMDNRIEGADVPNEYFLNIINVLQLKDVHIYSQGQPSNFECFKKCVMHLDEELFDNFIDLVSAKILVISPSSFSYAAALLNENIIYYRPFWHKPSNNWKIL